MSTEEGANAADVAQNPETAPLNGQQDQGSTAKPSRSRRPDLATLADVRREMGKVYRDMKRTAIKSQDGTRLVYVLSAIGKLIESSDLQERLEALERAIAARTH